MPYITEDLRAELDDAIAGLLDSIQQATELSGDAENLGGVLNYTITKILDGVHPGRYKDFERLIGMLECCKMELYRRKIAPYEDEKIASNGDVYE